MTKISDNLLTIALIVIGLVIMASPLALWVAWTDVGLFAVLATFVAAAVLYSVLVRYEKPILPGRGGRAGGTDPA
jgi:hypothetical protein